MSEKEDKPIVVTGIKKTKWTEPEGPSPDLSYSVSYVSLEWDIFDQAGGGDVVQVLQIQLIDGNLVIRHNDINFHSLFRVATGEE